MGYYTDYELQIIPDSDVIYDDLLSTYEYAFSNSWNTAEKDLAEFSKKYPEHTFILEGHGQEFDDVWQKHFTNGQVTHFKGRLVWDQSA